LERFIYPQAGNQQRIPFPAGVYGGLIYPRDSTFLRSILEAFAFRKVELNVGDTLRINLSLQYRVRPDKKYLRFPG